MDKRAGVIKDGGEKISEALKAGLVAAMNDNHEQAEKTVELFSKVKEQLRRIFLIWAKYQENKFLIFCFSFKFKITPEKIKPKILGSQTPPKTGIIPARLKLVLKN